MPLSNRLTTLRYEMLGEGQAVEYFHASEDRQAVRNRVFAAICEVGGFRFDAVCVEKRKAIAPLYHDPAKFYPKFAGYLLRHVFERLPGGTERVVLVTDRLPMKSKRGAVEGSFKRLMKENFGDRPFSVLHNGSAAHACLQAIDYLTWAVYRKWNSQDMRSYEVIAQLVASEFDIFRTGTTYYY